MERLAHCEEGGQPSWWAALVAPLRREVARDERPAGNGAAVVAPDGVDVAGPPGGEPSERTAELAQPAKERKRAVGTTAVGQVLANVYHDPIRHTVTLLLDERHASAVIYAARALAADYEAHAREVRAVAATLPPDSYGASNRQFIAIRHERIASRLRLVESNYRTEVSEGGRPAE